MFVGRTVLSSDLSVCCSIPENKKIMKYETEHYSNNICIA